MTMELVIRYFHFVSIILLAGALFSENMMLGQRIQRKTMKKLAAIDGIYGLASILLLTTGFLMWFWVGKGASFYSSNGLFHIKLTIFFIIAILSIFPTIFFLKNRKGNDEDWIDVPKKILLYARIEIFLLFLIPIFAVLMARGINF